MDTNFEELAQDEGRSMDRTYEAFPQFWEEHARQNRAFILDGMRHARLSSRDAVTILGVGPGRDVPLEDLAREFVRVNIVDVDRVGLERARESLPADLQGKIEIHVRDATGGHSERFALQGLAIVDSAATARQAFDRLQELFASWNPAIEEDPADPLRSPYVVSCMLATQLFVLGDMRIREAFQRKFQLELPVTPAESQLNGRFVREHMRFLASLAGTGGLVGLSSDLIDTPALSGMNAAELTKFARSLVAFLGSPKWLKSLPRDLRDVFTEFARLPSTQTVAWATTVLFMLIVGGREAPEGMQLAKLPPHLLRRLHGKQLSYEQAVILLTRFRELAYKVNPNAHRQTFPGDLREFLSDFETLGEIRHWYWYCNPAYLSAFHVGAVHFTRRPG